MIEVGYSGLRIYMLMIPMVGLHMMSVIYFQATGKPKQAIFLNLLRKVIIYMPVLIFLPKVYGLKGVWATVPISGLFSAIVAIGFIYYELKSTSKKHPDSLKSL